MGLPIYSDNEGMEKNANNNTSGSTVRERIFTPTVDYIWLYSAVVEVDHNSLPFDTTGIARYEKSTWWIDDGIGHMNFNQLDKGVVAYTRMAGIDHQWSLWNYSSLSYEESHAGSFSLGFAK